MGYRERLFLGGQTVSMLGDGLAVLTIPLLVLQLSHDPTVSALSAASRTLGHLFVGIPAGPIVDRVNPWRVLVVTDVVRTLLFLLLFAFAHTGVAFVLGIAFAAGIAQVFFETAFAVVVRDLFPGPGLVAANARIALAAQMSLVLGPAAVAVLVAMGSLRLALLVDASTFVVSVASLLAARDVHIQPAGSPGSLWREFVAGLRYLLRIRPLVVMTCLQIVVNFSLGTEKLIVYYARMTLGLSAAGAALVVAAGGCGGIVGALTAVPLARRVGQVRLIVSAVAVAGVAIGVMGFTGSMATLALAHLLYVWSLIVASVVNRSRRQALVAREYLGRVTSAARMLFLAVDPLGVLVAGWLTSVFGGDPRPVFVGAGAVVVVAAAAGRGFGLR